MKDEEEMSSEALGRLNSYWDEARMEELNCITPTFCGTFAIEVIQLLKRFRWGAGSTGGAQ